MHYRRWSLYGDPAVVKQEQLHGASLLERWQAHVDCSGSGCWEWQGARDRNGYGRLRVGKLPELAHRIAWKLFRGDPGSSYVCHKCDNPPCCRPEHLFIGDQYANMADKMAKKRHRYGVSRGTAHGCAKLTDEQVKEIRASSDSPNTLAARYNVGRRTIRDIQARRSWRHLP